MSDMDITGRVGPRRRFRTLRILDAAAISLSPASVLIATITAILLRLTGPSIEQTIANDLSTFQTLEFLGSTAPRWETVVHVEAGSRHAITGPWTSLIKPFVSILHPEGGFFDRLSGLFGFFVALGLLSVAGGILCRRSASVFVGDEQATVNRSVTYGLRRWVPTFVAPLIPLAAAVFLAIVLAAMGILGRLPLGGSLWMYIISPVAAILGFAMAFLLIATLLGWPLMVAAIATDDCDSFGGLSRAFSMMTGRPWRAAAYAFVAAVAGIALMSVVIVVGEVTIWCGFSAASIGSGQESAQQALLTPLTRIVHELVAGIGASFFWSASTVMFLMLRQDVDGVPLDRIATDPTEPSDREPFPVVGMPATDVQTVASPDAVEMTS